MKDLKLNKIINNIRENMTVGGGGFAGLPPDEPPVDLRLKKFKKIPYFFRDRIKGKNNVRSRK